MNAFGVLGKLLCDPEDCDSFPLSDLMRGKVTAIFTGKNYMTKTVSQELSQRQVETLRTELEVEYGGVDRQVEVAFYGKGGVGKRSAEDHEEFLEHMANRTFPYEHGSYKTGSPGEKLPYTHVAVFDGRLYLFDAESNSQGKEIVVN